MISNTGVIPRESSSAGANQESRKGRFMRLVLRSTRTAGVALVMSVSALCLVAQQPSGTAASQAQGAVQAQVHSQDQPPTPQLKPTVSASKCATET